MPGPGNSTELPTFNIRFIKVIIHKNAVAGNYIYMKLILGCILVVFCCQFSFSQDLTKFHLYNTTENAEKEIATAVKEAKAQSKHVMIQIGGNWCIWCARFNDFVTTDKQLDSLVKANYIVYHMNYSKENYNAKQLTSNG